MTRWADTSVVAPDFIITVFKTLLKPRFLTIAPMQY